MYTYGGPVINERNQVIDTRGQTIPRLYAAGDASGETRALSGTGEALATGMFTGRQAAALEPWK